MQHPRSRAVLLRRSGLVCVTGAGPALPDQLLDAAEIELGRLGFCASTALRNQLAALSSRNLARTITWIVTTIAEQLGAADQHRPLFRNFPDDIPANTHELWVQRVLSHFLQSPDQPCLFCGAEGSVHVLRPCAHVVCDNCFDGSNYSACPVCNRQVDENSPFFKPSDKDRTRLPREAIRFKRLDLGDFQLEIAEFLHAICRREQPPNPTDRQDLETVVEEMGSAITKWLPDDIPIKETTALVVGALFKSGAVDAAVEQATLRLRTATDVLRTIAAMSGADPALQGERYLKPETVILEDDAWRRWAQRAGLASSEPRTYEMFRPVRNRRFKVTKLSRRTRRGLLGLLEGFDANRLTEDMLRHRSYWVWLGEFLHPHEYAERFPNVARAFRIVRKKAPDGTPAPRFQTFYSRLEQAINADDGSSMLAVLRERPGELARRLDHLIRVASDDEATTATAIDTFVHTIPQLSTPMLVSLRTFLSSRTEPAPVRVYWPKGGTTAGVFASDERQPLPEPTVRAAVTPIERELLDRFERLQPFAHAVIDQQLQNIVVPFNERTASNSAVDLPRGSAVPIEPDRVARLFLHWCEPEQGGTTTDLDLSVGLYDKDWKYAGVCSYYELKHPQRSSDANVIALSAGDLTSARFPDGASEFIDVHRARAAAAGIRYAVMVVNAYSGLPFSALERAYAGLMMRGDIGGKHFDARSVLLKFQLRGEKGVFIPFVLDLDEDRLHWIDAYARGNFAFNNVETSNRDIQTVCPSLMQYFASRQRPSMYDLALMHAAARCRQVHIRGSEPATFVRADGEPVTEFLRRLRYRIGPDRPADIGAITDSTAVLACLFRAEGIGDVRDGSSVYALFRDGLTANITASDLLTVPASMKD